MPMVWLCLPATLSIALFLTACGGSRSAPPLQNPTPAIAAISPHFVVAGLAAQSITLTGTDFLPSTTATYAGAPHAITYVNSSTITLPLSASDLATVGVQAIILSNPAPGGGTAVVNLPVLYETDATLARSQLAAGNQARLQRLFEKGRAGTPVTIAAFGGSITWGGAASDQAHAYASLLLDWWNQNFPASTGTLVNAGIGATGSDYGSLRAPRDVLSHNPDLVIVEFAVNDLTGGVKNEGDTYEGVVRQMLDAPSQPAVILLFMMTYKLPIVEATVTSQRWQSAIGANYDLPMVSYFDAISPELTNGNISLAEITPDAVHPSDLGHAYTAQFLEQALATAIAGFPAGSALENIPATQAPLYSRDFEFTSLEDGNGTEGSPLNPTSNEGWIAVSSSPGIHSQPGAGLDTSTFGSTLDFTVTGKDILIGYDVYNGAMGQASVTVDGVAGPTLDGWFDETWGGYRGMTRVANGLTSGPHQVHVELLSTKDSGSTGNDFYLLSVGAGGVQ